MFAPWLKTGIQVAQKDQGANVHHHKHVLLRFETSSPFYSRFRFRFRFCFGVVLTTIVLKARAMAHLVSKDSFLRWFEDDRH